MSRLICVTRALMIIQLLSNKRMTLGQLMKETGTCEKTVRRYIRSIEDAGIPIICSTDCDEMQDHENQAWKESRFYKIDHHWVRSFR